MKRVKRALLTTAAAATLVVGAASGTALAAPPQSVPNSAASGNCVATSSGILFFERVGIRLGKDVSRFAPHGGQRDFIQGEQATCGGQAR